MCQVFNENAKGDYGADSMREDYIQFADKGTKEGNGDNIVFTHVAVNDKEGKNVDIAKTLGMNPSFTTPRLFLFKPGDVNPYPYPVKATFTDDAFTAFVAKHSDFFLGIDGLEPRFELITKKFVAAHHIEYDALIAEAEAALDPLPEKQRVSGDWVWVLIMLMHVMMC